MKQDCWPGLLVVWKIKKERLIVDQNIGPRKYIRTSGANIDSCERILGLGPRLYDREQTNFSLERILDHLTM